MIKRKKLSLNIKNTHYVVFTRSEIRKIHSVINVDRESIDEVKISF